MENVLILNREKSGRLVISYDMSLVTPHSLLLDGKEIETIYKVYKRTKVNRQNLTEILDYICILCNVSKKMVISKNRSVEYALARQLYCYTARLLTTKSLKTIGEEIRRDHATVKHSIKVIEWYKETNNQKVIETLEQIFDTFDYKRKKDKDE